MSPTAKIYSPTRFSSRYRLQSKKRMPEVNRKKGVAEERARREKIHAGKSHVPDRPSNPGQLSRAIRFLEVHSTLSALICFEIIRSDLGILETRYDPSFAPPPSQPARSLESRSARASDRRKCPPLDSAKRSTAVWCSA